MEDRLWQAINGNPKISRRELAVNLGIGLDTVKEYIAKLKGKGILKRVGGNTKAGEWIIMNRNKKK